MTAPDALAGAPLRTARFYSSPYAHLAGHWLSRAALVSAICIGLTRLDAHPRGDRLPTVAAGMDRDLALRIAIGIVTSPDVGFFAPVARRITAPLRAAVDLRLAELLPELGPADAVRATGSHPVARDISPTPTEV